MDLTINGSPTSVDAPAVMPLLREGRALYFFRKVGPGAIARSSPRIGRYPVVSPSQELMS